MTNSVPGWRTVLQTGMRTSAFLLVLACACNRGPAPPAQDEAEPESTMAATMSATMDPHAGMAAHPNGPPGDPHAGLGLPTGGGGGATVTEQNPTLAGVTWNVQEPLTWRRPTRPMRNAEYVVTGDGGEAVMTVFHFPGMGGAVRDNINRWAGQFTDDSGAAVREPDIQEKTVHGLAVTTVDVRGTFSGGMGGGGPQPNSRMLAAIVVGPSGPIFFKLVGPESIVEDAKSAFDGLIDSVEATR